MATTINAGNATSGAAISADTTGVLQLQSGSTPTTAVTVTTGQAVGIGTTTPYVPLQVTGTIKVATGNAQGILSLGDGNGATTNCGIYRGAAGSPTTDGNYLNIGGYDGTVFTTGNAAIASQTERMRIDSSGRVLIGSTATNPAPSNTYGIALNVDGSGNAYAGAAQFSANGSAAIVLNRGSDDGATMAFRRTGTQVGSITVTSSSTAYNTSSDYRLKENIAPMQNALNVVQQLKPVTYTWKADNSNGQGFIAHELAEVCPHAVTGEKDAVDAEGNPVYQGIDTSFLIATLTAAIQELNAKVTALEAQLGAK